MKTITITLNGNQVVLGVNKSNVLYVPGPFSDNAVGVIHEDGTQEIDYDLVNSSLPEGHPARKF